MTDPATGYAHLVAYFEGHPDVLSGQMFATQHKGVLVFKRPPEAHARAMALAGATRWNSSGKTVLREWVSIPAQNHAHFQELALAAAQFFGGTS